MALPGVSSTWVDNQLSQPSPGVTRNSSVLVMGTAGDGPLYEPVTIRNVADAKAVFGAFGDGTLIRGIEEVYLAAGRGTSVDVRALRLGGGKVSKLELKEATGTAGTLSDDQDTGYAVLIQARVPGDVYNLVSVGSRDGRTIEILNPKSGLVSQFNYDPNRKNTQADIHTVAELVDAINSDINLNSILTAEYQSLIAHYEIYARYGFGLNDDAEGNWNASASGIYRDSSGRTHITLADRAAHWTDTGTIFDDGDPVESSGVLTQNLLDENAPSGSYTSGNNIQQLLRVYSIADVGSRERLHTAGVSEVLTNHTILNKSDNTTKSSLTAIEDYDSDGRFWVGPDAVSTSNVSEYRHVVDRLLIGAGAGSAKQAFTFDAPVCPDDGDTTDTATTLVRKAISDGNNVLTTSTTGYAVATDLLLAGNLIDGDGRQHNWKGQTVTASGTIEVFYNNSTTPIPVSNYSSKAGVEGTAGNVGVSWEGDVSATSGDSPEATITFNSGSEPPEGTNVYVSYRSIRHTLTEQNTLIEVQDPNDTSVFNWRNYFVAGNKITFRSTVPSDIEVRYQKVTDYEVGTEVSLVEDPVARQGDGSLPSNTYSTVRFNDPNNQPGPGPSGLVHDKDTVLGFQYEFLPEMPSFTSFKNLTGGTNGDVITAANLYDELETAYAHIENYPVDIVIPMQASLDAVKETVDPATGLTQETNAGFHTQLAGFLNRLTENVNETIGVIGVESPLQVDPGTISRWVDGLVDVIPGDSTRAANVYSGFDERLVQVVMFEPVFGNDLENISYAANGAAAYGGLIAGLPNRVSPTNKPVRNAINLRFNLSRRQLERLVDSRYVAAHASISAPGQFVITDSPTAAAVGSDYSSLSTVRIVVEAMDIVRGVAEPFIGTGNTPAKILSMNSAITAGLRQMVDTGSLNAFDFEIVSTPEMRARHLVDIELLLVPAFEIKQIRTFVRLRSNL